MHVDPEDGEQGILWGQLPARQEILDWLHNKWHGLLGADDTSDITLRYLGGKVHVDVVLSPDIAAGDCKKARGLSTGLADAVRDLGDIGEVKVYFR